MIVIIALLAAIMFPVFSQARESARRASCQGNLRQIGLAMDQYTQDYDERYPSLYLDRDAKTLIDTWSLLMPYAKSEQLFECPSDTRPIPTNPFACSHAGSCLSNGKSPSYGFNTGAGYGDPLSYSAVRLSGIFSNSYPINSGSSQIIYQGASLAQVQEPSKIFVAGDSYGNRVDTQRSGINALGWRSYNASTFPTRQSAWRHRNWRNMLYSDGHVKAIRWVSANNNGWVGMFPLKESDYEGFCLSMDVTVYGDLNYTCVDEMKGMRTSYAPNTRLLPE